MSSEVEDDVTAVCIIVSNIPTTIFLVIKLALLTTWSIVQKSLSVSHFPLGSGVSKVVGIDPLGINRSIQRVDKCTYSLYMPGVSMKSQDFQEGVNGLKSLGSPALDSLITFDGKLILKTKLHSKKRGNQKQLKKHITHKHINEKEKQY